MISILGTFSLASAAICSLFSIFGYFTSLISKKRSTFYNKNARLLNYVSIISIALAFVFLEIGLFRKDYSIKYVYEHTANSTSKLFTLTGAWAGLEGSLLLWALILGIFSLSMLFATRIKANDKGTFNGTSTLANLIIVSIVFFFSLLIAVSSSPFATTSTFYANGLGPNPLLQEHFAMAIHPPLLYTGYVGFVVPFAYAIASLIRKDFSQLYSARVRRTSIIAWIFLTCGILLGAFWSYEVLGWGGYWAWDPVENASFLPWLTATAFLHSTIMQSKRNMLRGWNYTVVVATFALTILGTFLTRSGIVNSVHAFSQSDIGIWLLSLFAVIVLGGVSLLIWRYDFVKSEKPLKGAGIKDTLFLLNNILFCIFTFVVLIGTTYPLIADEVRGEQISIGTPYFEKFAIPLGLTIMLLMGVAPMMAFGETNVKLAQRLRLPVLAGAITMAFSVTLNQGLVTALAIGMSAYVVVGAIQILARAGKQSGYFRLIFDRPKKVGAMVSHIGIALIGLCFVLSSHSYSFEATLVKDVPQKLGPYSLTFVKEDKKSNSDVISTSVGIEIVRKNENFGVYAPKVNEYPARSMSVGTPSVHTSFIRDSYLTLLSTPADEKGVRSVRVKITENPMVLYIWLSGALIALGAIITLIPTKRKADALSKKVKV
jgi:cytochrome c-type biogenesis protein CcmF